MERWKDLMNSGSASGTARAERDTYAMIMPRLSTPMIAQRTEGVVPATDFSGVVVLVIKRLCHLAELYRPLTLDLHLNPQSSAQALAQRAASATLGYIGIRWSTPVNWNSLPTRALAAASRISPPFFLISVRQATNVPMPALSA